MPTHDLGDLLSAALVKIRKRTTRTQDRWAERTGMSQSYISAAELGKSGWESIRTIAVAVERAGADPVDLLRLALAEVDQDESVRELTQLWTMETDADLKSAILTLLRSSAASRNSEER